MNTTAAEPTPIPFNVNQYVRVKLTDHGRDIYMEFFDGFGVETGPPYEEEDGWAKFQLWHLMEVFGEHMQLGRRCPFDTAIELLPDPSL